MELERLTQEQVDELLNKHEEILKAHKDDALFWCALESQEFSNIFIYKNISELNLSNHDLSRLNFTNTNAAGCLFENTTITNTNFYDCNLYAAKFNNSKITSTDFKYSMLNTSEFKNAVVQSVNFYHSSIVDACFDYAVFREVDFSHTNLTRSYFESITLYDVSFEAANLQEVTIKGKVKLENNIYACAYMGEGSGADFTHANLCEAEIELEHEKLFEQDFRFGAILDKPIRVYKKCPCQVFGSKSKYLHTAIVELEIPKGAIVFSINNYKCRTNVAKVVKILECVSSGLIDNDTETEWKYIDGITNYVFKDCDEPYVYSYYNPLFKYKVGETVRVKDFSLIYNEECAKGIHFFRTIKEAVNY